MQKRIAVASCCAIFFFAGWAFGQRQITGKVDNAVSSFYGDYRNVSVCWNQAVQFSIWSLSGDAVTDQEIDAARKSKAESDCK
jgi:hypothetical protein